MYKRQVTDWKAWSQRAGGMSEIRLKDGQDEDAGKKLEQVMKELSSNPYLGILEVLDRKQAIERGGFPLADYVLVSQKGYEIPVSYTHLDVYKRQVQSD